MTIDASFLTHGKNDNVASWSTDSVSPQPYSLLFLFINYARGSSTVPVAPTSVSGLGLTWELVSSKVYDTSGVGRRSCYLYRAMGASPTPGTITVTDGYSHTDKRSVYTLIEVAAADPTGSNGAGAVVQAVAGTAGTTDTPSATLAAFGSANNGTLGFAAYSPGASAPTAGTGFTLLDSYVQSSTQPVACAAQWRADNDTSVDIALASGDGLYGSAMIAVEVKAAVIRQLSGTATLDVAATAAVSSFTPGVQLAGTATLDVAATVAVSSFKPRSRPRREFLWVYDVNGVQVDVIT